MSDIVEFLCVKIQAHLDDYARTGIVPSELYEGIFSADDIQHCLPQLPEKYFAIGNALVRAYTRELQKNFKTIKENLRAEYHHTLENLQTKQYELVYPSVVNRYRPDINPVAALYYDARELTRNYNPEDDRHVWLHSVITETDLNNKILDALSADLRELERIVKKYYWPLTQLDDRIPLELFHARQLIKDFSQFYVFFAGVVTYDPDQHQ